MRRRSFLRSVTGTAALGLVGVAGAHPKGSGGGQEAPDSATPVGPDPLGTLTIDGAAEAVVRDGTTAFVAATDGFAVVDASDPTALATVYETDAVLADHDDGPLPEIWDLKVDGDRLLVAGPANAGPAGVHAAVVYDVADPTAPERVAVHETDYPIHNCFLADGVAYLTANDGDTNALVTVDAESGTELGRWSVLDHDEAWADVGSFLRVLHDVWVRDDRAYLAYWDAGTWILDVSDPSDPAFVSRVRGRPATELAAVEDVSRESTERPGNDHFVTVDESGTLLGVGVESWAADEDADRGPGGIHLYDVADPTDPAKLASIDPPPTPDPTRDGVWTTAHNFDLVDDRLYSSWYQGGVKVHDVADPADPRELFHWRDAGRAMFWTAQRGVPGEFFLASSWRTPDGSLEPGEDRPGRESEPTDADGPGGLFAFPDPDAGDATATTATASGVDRAQGDGFGPLAALGGAALGVGALWRRRGPDRD